MRVTAKTQDPIQPLALTEESPNLTWEEIGFAEFPIVTTSLKRPPFNTLEFVEPIGTDADGEPLHRTWKMVSSSEYGLPRLPDLDLFVAILKALERHNYEKKLIACTAMDICADVGLKPGGETYHRLRAAFLRFQTTDYVAKNVFIDRKTKARVLSEGWSVITDHRIATDAPRMSAKDGLPPSFFAVSSTLVNRLREGQRKSVDLGMWRQLPLGLEKPIYRYLDKNFHGPKEHHEIGLRKFSDRIGLTGRYKPYDLKRLYRKPLDNLVALGFLSRFIFERSRSADDPEKLVVVPGRNARTQRGATTRVPHYQNAAEPPSDARISGNSGIPEAASDQLVTYFSSKQFGIEKTTATARERATAARILEYAAGDLATAQAIIDFAIAESRNTRFNMRNIGGVLTNSYPERAIGALRERRTDPAASARRVADANTKQDYEAWYLTEVRKRLAALTPDERELLATEASAELRAGKHGDMFDRWPDQRKLLVDHKVRRRIGQDLPSFEEWKVRHATDSAT